jgi:two-component system, LytTR family, response regulator LytT
MKIVIIEDEAPALRRLEKLLRQVEPTIQIVATFDSVNTTVEYLQTQPLLDLIITDIQLADGLSFEIFQQVNVTIPIIFTTAFDEYAIRAFKVNSIDYLLKPIDTELLRKSIEKYKNLTTKSSETLVNPLLSQLLEDINRRNVQYRQRFLVSYRDTFIRLEITEIAYFYSEARLTHLITHTGKKYVIPETLEELEITIDPAQFMRANRQFIIHHSAIQQIVSHFGGKLKIKLLPDFSEEIFVSREKASVFKEWLNQ